jgi:hypothetical protein
MKRVPPGVTAILVAASLLGGPSAIRVGATQTCSSAWSIVPSPNVGTGDNVLNAVTAVSSSNVWAVGSYRDGTRARTLIEHWNGVRWRVVRSPNPSGWRNVLNGVADIPRGGVWAVGYRATDEGRRTLIERWHDGRWSVVPSPNGGGVANILSGVSALSPHNAWAVGASGRSTLIERWDGDRWSVVASPSPSTGDALSSVVAISARDAWAVGHVVQHEPPFAEPALFEHWNGQRWTATTKKKEAETRISMEGVAAASPSDIWAAGFLDFQGGAGLDARLARWDGTGWRIRRGPTSGVESELLGLARVPGSHRFWAVGWFEGSAELSHTLVEHRTPSGWKRFPSANEGTSDSLTGISLPAGGKAWAVGTFSDGGVPQTLVERRCAH